MTNRLRQKTWPLLKSTPMKNSAAFLTVSKKCPTDCTHRAVGPSHPCSHGYNKSFTAFSNLRPMYEVHCLVEHDVEHKFALL